MEKLKIVLAEDHRILREGLKRLIDEQPNMEVVGEADDGIDAWQKTCELLPDVVLMDVSMPRMNGADATAKIRELCPQVKVIALGEVILVAAVRIAYEIGVILKDGQLALKTLLMHLILGIIEQVFQNALAGFVVDHDIHGAGALRRGIFRMAPRIEIEARPIFEKDVQKTFRGNELLKEITHHFF